MDEHHPLFDSRLKIKRARELADDLEAKKDEPPGGVPYQYKSRQDPLTGDKLVRLDVFPKWPPEWGVTAGEIAFHLRSALDYLVFQLSGEGGGKPESSRTAFPISEEEDEYFKAHGKRGSYRDQCLSGVDPTWAAKIDSLQPFNDPAIGGVKNLAHLNSLTNRDKHQVRHPCYTWVTTPIATVVFEKPEIIELRLSSSDKLSVLWGGTPPKRHDTRNVISLMPPAPTDDDWGTAVVFGPKFISISHLGWMVDSVEAIIDGFEPAFSPAATSD